MCKTRTHLKSHHKWAYRILRATQLLVIQQEVLHRQGSKCPRKPIPGPYIDCPALLQQQSTTLSRHLHRQTTPPIGGPETTSVIDNVSKIKHTPPHCFIFCGFFFSVFSEAGEREERGVPKLPRLIHLPAPRQCDD
jgi:hypothetical protein